MLEKMGRTSHQLTGCSQKLVNAIAGFFSGCGINNSPPGDPTLILIVPSYTPTVVRSSAPTFLTYIRCLDARG